MSLVRVDVETIVVGGGPIASLVVLKPRNVAPAESAPRAGAEVADAAETTEGVDTVDVVLDEIEGETAESDLTASASPADAPEPTDVPRATNFQPLPIRLGVTEAATIGMGVDNPLATRPMTHDLFLNVLRELGASVQSAAITGVQGMTFFASLNLALGEGQRMAIDARPSDAIALALRAKAPIFVDEAVLRTASCPDFEAVQRDENQKSLEEFQAFLEEVTPEDFSRQN